MSSLNLIHTAYRGFVANKLRAALTTLGVMIGVSSVIVMLALGRGARLAVEASYRDLGSDIIQISTRQEYEDGQLQRVGEPLSYKDGLLLPRSVNLVESVEMWLAKTARIRYRGAAYEASITGTTASLYSVLRRVQARPLDWSKNYTPTDTDIIRAGRFFTSSEVSAATGVCVLGRAMARDLFARENPLDQFVWVNRQRYRVIGVLEELEIPAAERRYNADPNDLFLVPISTMIHYLYDEDPLLTINAKVRDQNRMDDASAQIASYLRRRHAIHKRADSTFEDDFTLTTRRDLLGAQQEAAQTFAVLLAGVALISLVVGGIGIMNVMLVSVAERTREIGVRLAVGARPADIVWQFLLESILISTLGGIVGIVIGVLAIPVTSVFFDRLMVLIPTSIVWSFGIAVLTGVLFGLYPALRASRMNPIDVLHNE